MLTQSSVEDYMRAVWKRCEVPRNQHPRTFRELLTFLEDQRLISGVYYVEYDFCKVCGFIYRGEHHTCSTCPSCQADRSDHSGTYLHR